MMLFFRGAQPLCPNSQGCYGPSAPSGSYASALLSAVSDPSISAVLARRGGSRGGGAVAHPLFSRRATTNDERDRWQDEITSDVSRMACTCVAISVVRFNSEGACPKIFARAIFFYLAFPFQQSCIRPWARSWNV